MKKKFFLLPCIAAVAIATVVGTKTFKSNADERNELLMANVEALSQGESSKKVYTCYSTITEKDGCQVRYCQTCTFVPGTDVWYSFSSTCER